MARMDQAEWKPQKINMRKNSFAGRLVVFEGIDGSGKTTLSDALHNQVTARGIECLVLTAPSREFRQYWAWKSWHDTPQFRSTIDEFGLSVMALGDRLVVQSNVIVPALKRGALVISDRYALSVLAYWSTPVHRQVLSRLIAPDLGFLCVVAPELAARRTAATRKEPEELRNSTLLRRLHQRYKLLQKLYQYTVLTTSGPVETVMKNVSIAMDSVFAAESRDT